MKLVGNPSLINEMVEEFRMKAKPLRKAETSIEMERELGGGEGGLIDLSGLMEIRKARRTLEKNCRELAKAASQTNEDLESCQNTIRELQESLSSLSGELLKDGTVTQKEEH